MSNADATHATGGGLPWLVADVGGTNARFGWVEDIGRGVEHVRQMSVAGQAGPADAVRAYLSLLPAGSRPRRAASQLSSEGVADPSTTAIARRAASATAMSRAE